MAPRFHIAMLPWFAVGHMTPFLHLSNKLAEKGHKISFFLPRKAQTLMEHHNLHPDLITFHPLTVPHVDGLPPGTETASDIPISSASLLSMAMDLTRDQMEVSIQAMKPSFIFYDFTYWIPEIARKHGIKSICYTVVSAASVAIALVPARKASEDKPISEEDLRQPPPGYPSETIVLREHETRSLMFINLPFGDGITFYDRVITAMKECDALVMRTCEEVEGKLCDYLGSQFNKQVILTGPVLPDPSVEALDQKWANWLGGFGRGSVLYCAFGSQYILEKDQFQELVLGFELTGLPFLIRLKPPMGASSVEEALPEGFQERTKGRGIVYGGWVQQPQIIGHPSVGCFVTHCGFGSMWESLMCDCQIVLVPYLGDQILNTRLLTDELEVAVEVEREENGWFAKESLCKAIKSVMDEGSEVGELVRRNHIKWKETLCSPDFMSGYVDRFAKHLEELHNN